MENLNDQLTQDIMRRIQKVYVWKAFLRPFALECAAFAALIGTTAFFVSLKNVVGNAYATHSFTAEIKYFGSAFLNTELSVKVISLASLVILALILRDTMFSIGRAAGKVRAAFS